MSLLLDKTGHFVRPQSNRENGLQINPPNFLLYAHYYYPNPARPARNKVRGISGVFPAGPPTPFLVRFAPRPFSINNQSMDKEKDADLFD
jgi:hypothetical protein